MEKDKIFFAESGLTSTSANHVANLAKEMIQNLGEEVDSIKFYTTKVSLLSEESEKTISIGNTLEDLESLPKKLKLITEAKSLIAWLREAIKARQKLLSEVEELRLEDYCKMNNIAIPEEPKYKSPMTEDEYYGSLSVKERNTYYQLETEVSVIGKCIHQLGSLSQARKDLKKRKLNPFEVKGEGRDAIIYSYIPSIKEEAIEDMFFKLQTRHREVQAQLNKIKFECEKALNNSTMACNTEYAEEQKEYSVIINKLYAELTKYKKEASVKISDLKIIIPNDLKDIYNKVVSLSK